MSHFEWNSEAEREQFLSIKDRLERAIPGIEVKPIRYHGVVRVEYWIWLAGDYMGDISLVYDGDHGLVVNHCKRMIQRYLDHFNKTNNTNHRPSWENQN